MKILLLRLLVAIITGGLFYLTVIFPFHRVVTVKYVLIALGMGICFQLVQVIFQRIENRRKMKQK